MALSSATWGAYRARVSIVAADDSLARSPSLRARECPPGPVDVPAGNLLRFLLAASVLVLNGAVMVYLFERHAPGSNIHTLGESL